MLYCPCCDRDYSKFRYLCECGAVLLCGPRLRWAPTGNGVWRYANLLPTKKSISMDEGNTPLIRRRDTHKEIYMKFEGDNPTGSFKDRGTTVVLSHAKNIGKEEVGVASTGNMGASVAAYAAYGNLKAKVFIPAKTPKNKIAQIIAYGAEIVKVKGDFHDCVRKLLRSKLYMAETGLNPYYVEGEKTIGYEIYEEIGAPDNIIVPTGTGGLITAIFKSFYELKQMRKIGNIPRMIAVQPRNCSPIIDAFETGSEIKPVRRAKTIASAILVKSPFNGYTAIAAMENSGGFGVKVSEREIRRGIKELGAEGIFAEPAAATAIAAADKIDLPGKTVLIITGHGLKQPVV